MRTTHPLADIYLYLRVAELGSIRAAAMEAQMEPSSLSRKLTSLEQRLECKLLDRGQGNTMLTNAGELYYQKMRLILPQFEEIEADIKGESTTPKGLLTVNAAIDFGQEFVTDWLLSFRKIYPQVEVQLTLASQYVDLVADGIDVAIRVGQLKDSALKARRIAKVPRVLVASKKYLDEHGIVKTPNDLKQHQHIFFSAPTRNTPITMLDSSGKSTTVERTGKVSINAVRSVVKAVIDGEGIHAGPRWAFEPYLNSGQLVHVLPEYSLPIMDMHAIWSPASVMPARTRKFIDYVIEQAPKVPGLLAP